MIDAKRLQSVKEKCGFSEGLCLSSVGLSGGIGFWWNDLNITLISYSTHHVAVEVRDDDDVPLWAAVGIYGWPEASNKHLTWALMKEIRGVLSLPIVFFGDFNEILHASEKEGGAVRGERHIDEFRETVELCELGDLGYSGGAFTWQRGLEERTIIRERLDRFLACDRWGTLFPHAWVKNFPIYKSDHAPILLSTDSGQQERRKGKRFHFEALWLSNSDCQTVVKQAWATSGGSQIDERIAGCASELQRWAAVTFGDVKKRIKKKEEELQVWQNKAPDGRMLGKCKELVRELDELNRLHESYWHARARANEMKDGDKNTSYFHHKASQRKKRNAIHKLRDSAGVWKTDEKDVSAIISDYFTNIFASSSPANFDDALAGLSPKVPHTANEVLMAEPTVDEVRDALFQMHPNKAPGVDGMHALFYQKFWHIVGDDIVLFIRDWWNGRVQIGSLNRTCIVLIPKCSNPQQMGDFRPISLCTVLYKILSKMMANRLKVFLSDLISLHQSAFVPGRLITDNAMTAFEIFHSMKRGGDGKKGVMAFKLDMSKAYDRVEWSFLERVMGRLGFCEGWVRRIMECLSSVSYSFKLNGSVEGNIIPSRGLRQGDPLSPYLFLLCAEAFSALLSKAAGDGLIHGARVCRSAPRISHLFFADDSILFTRAALQECSVVADILSTYERASGQKINFDKSEVSFSKNVDDSRKNDIRSLFGVREVERHEKYLGLPTVIGRSKKMVFTVLKERVWKKLQGWKEKLLSRAGKEVLLKAVIQSIPTYMMSLFAIPDCILSEINAMCARFWWGSRGTERRMHWLSWEKMCLPKAYGGMGFRDLKVFNQALLAKQGWRLLCHNGSMAHAVFNARYYPRSNFLNARRGFDPSYVWRSIWGAKSLLLEGLKWRVGDGSSIGVWEESWLPGESAAVVPTPNMESPADLRVSDLLDASGRWDELVLRNHFTEEDILLIREIPLSSRKPPDLQYWWPSTDGFFTTKSAYWLGRLGHLRGWLGHFGGANGEVWKVIWGLEGPPKLKHFLWRACMGALATRGRLKERHIVEDGCCTHCNREDESIVHAIFRCSLVSPIWENSPFTYYVRDGPTSSFMDFFVWLISRMERTDLLSFMAMAWAAWSYRNSVTFEEPWSNVTVSVVGFMKLVSDYKSYAALVFRAGPVTTGFPSRSSWVAPDEGRFRLNTDAAMLAEGLVGVGAVVRDSRGSVLLVAVRRYRVRWTVTLAEAMGARFGVEMAKQFGYEALELECDASNITKALCRKAFGRSPTDLVLEDVSMLGDSFPIFSISHVKRGGNTVAHFVARLYPADGVQHVFVNDFPQGVLALAELDVN
ncbi:uncharacterized protein LOC104897695 [Beta vulgaris subsp. vulgaris]|uniref:uncharacterized protein LOC104897695 n=1 Tax=Beta vulgaris subsp. vulgaris TaxID=3555 RepID=UPI00053F2FFA|nr:uncharacterized protein LOC104897695 [Beta vulgaris subsp. vulgaris]